MPVRTVRRRRTGLAALLAAFVLVVAVATGSVADEPLHGHDVSWPQCSVAQGGYDLPLQPPTSDFVVIGLTKGLAFTENPCLAEQLAWARTNGTPVHGYTMATFPTSAQLAAHGRSGPWTGTDRASQLRNVGYAETRFATETLVGAGWAPPVVWVDVEPRPAQPWPGGGATAVRENRYVIEGVLRGLRDARIPAGVYSYAYGWQEITGGWQLPSVPVWATAGKLDYPTEAQDRCVQTSFSGGPVYLSQWTDGVRDYNITCGSYRFTALPERWSGTDRYATSAAISSGFPAGKETVYVAGAETFPDALSGSAAAGRDGAPVVLVRRDSVPAEVAAELSRLRPERIVVLGGTDAVGPEVAAQLRQYTTGELVRLRGQDRYATSAAVASTYADSTTVYVAAGEAFPDALSGSAAAARERAPLVLVRRDSLPAEVAAQLTRIQPDRIVVLGGTAAVDAEVVAELGRYTAGPVTRIAGADRYATSAAVAATYPASTSSAFVASGEAFADALAGAPAAAREAAPVLLVRPGAVPTDVSLQLERFTLRRAVVLGGSAAVSDTVARNLSAELG